MPSKATYDFLAKFQRDLIGVWENYPIGGSELGGPDMPLSYNVMPLPQTSSPNGYILKNFKFAERIRFNDNCDDTTLAIAARAPNRGGQVNQVPGAVFYEQQVRFAEGPGKNKVVHVENGSWLWLPRYRQIDGPYPPDPTDTDRVSDSLQQPEDILIAKQMAVPHGNSILALGNFDTVPKDAVNFPEDESDPDKIAAGFLRGDPVIKGRPHIPDGLPCYPQPATPVPSPLGKPLPNPLVSLLNADTVFQSKTTSPGNNFQNPHPGLTQCPNAPIQRAVALIEPDSFIHWRVSTEPSINGRGHVTNIPFEQRVANVTAYIADYWMLLKGDRRYLAYNQVILMEMDILVSQPGHPCVAHKFVFPHTTCNLLTQTWIGADCSDPKKADRARRPAWYPSQGSAP
jgi:hypothetical protein